MKKTREIIRHRKLIKELTNGKAKTKKQALLNAGYSLNTAKKKSARTIRKIAQTGGLKTAIERAGLSDQYLAKKLLEITKATKKTYAQYRGIIMDERTDPDYQTQRGGVDLITILKGDKSEKMEIAHTLGEMTPDEVIEALKRAGQIVDQGKI